MDRLESLQVMRGFTDSTGTRTTVSTHSIEGMISWNFSRDASGRYTAQMTGRESAQIMALLIVPVGADVKPRDRVVRGNGEMFAIVGYDMWAEGNPLVDETFDPVANYMVFQLDSVNG